MISNTNRASEKLDTQVMISGDSGETEYAGNETLMGLGHYDI